MDYQTAKKVVELFNLDEDADHDRGVAESVLLNLLVTGQAVMPDGEVVTVFTPNQITR